MIQAEQDYETMECFDVSDIMNKINKNDSSYLIFNSNDEDQRDKVLKSYERAYVLKIYNHSVNVPTDISKSNSKKVENNNDKLPMKDNVAVKIVENLDSEQTSEAIATITYEAINNEISPI